MLFARHLPLSTTLPALLPRFCPSQKPFSSPRPRRRRSLAASREDSNTQTDACSVLCRGVRCFRPRACWSYCCVSYPKKTKQKSKMCCLLRGSGACAWIAVVLSLGGRSQRCNSQAVSVDPHSASLLLRRAGSRRECCCCAVGLPTSSATQHFLPCTVPASPLHSRSSWKRQQLQTRSVEHAQHWHTSKVSIRTSLRWPLRGSPVPVDDGLSVPVLMLARCHRHGNLVECNVVRVSVHLSLRGCDQNRQMYI